MDVGVDERGQSRWTLHGRVEIQSQFRQQREIRAESRRGNDRINGADNLVVASDEDPLIGLGQPRHPEATDQAQPLVCDEPLHALTEFPPRRQRIVAAATEELSLIHISEPTRLLSISYA